MRYAAPDATFDGTNQFQLLEDEIKQGQFPAAATRLDALLGDSGDALFSEGDDGAVCSVNAWLGTMPDAEKQRMADAYDTAVGTAAQRALDALGAQSDADPGAFYALATRYPLSQAAGRALGEGARRSAALGDLPAARWMLNAAIKSGWIADAGILKELAAPSGDVPDTSGAVPFAASWYQMQTRQAWAALRSFPVGAGQDIFVTGPGRVVALNPNGSVLWNGPAGPLAIPGRGSSAPMGVTRGPPFSAAICCDSGDVPQLLVVRQPQIHSDGWALRALRASDGKLLWTTEGEDDFHGLVFGSNAAIVGRYAYAIAGEPSDQLDHLWLVAVEVTTGHLIWKCDIGAESRTAVPRPGMRARPDVYRPWLNESAPAVAGDMVVASPDVGAIVGVSRFDGKLRWARPYPAAGDPTDLLQRQREFAIEHSMTNVPLAAGLSLRWSNTPAISGDTVVAAPEDSDQVIAVGVRDGKPLWQASDYRGATVVGAWGNVVVLADSKLTGLSLQSGKRAWQDENATPVGPSVLKGDTVLVPTAGGVVGITCENGSASAEAGDELSFQKAIRTDVARGALVANDVSHCFRYDMERN
jgi:outer membrane protein assembly factor BamB